MVRKVQYWRDRDAGWDGMICFGHDALKGWPPCGFLFYRGSPKIGSICVSRTVPMEAYCRLLWRGREADMPLARCRLKRIMW
jgi:hypothetical protein